MKIRTRDLTRASMSRTNIRRRGRILFGEELNWSKIDRASELPVHVALSLMLVEHMVNAHVLDECEALAVLSFFGKAVTRYAEYVEEKMDEYEQREEDHDLKLPVALLEVIETRWARISDVPAVYDIEDGAEVTTVPTEPLPVHSHSVCLLPLLLQLRREENENGSEASCERSTD